MDILRFITAGNIDDGKSTLIGRLLYDTGNIKSDILESVTNANGDTDSINLAFITDGLRSERQHGITIDVAYKYFTTPARKYIITDAPGHFQYTKNLATGASATDAIIILIDAQNGITGQTRRHSMVAAFLQIKQVVVAINKMDAVAYDETIFNTIQNKYLAIAQKLQLNNITFIPISALHGDNVSIPSGIMHWYQGKTLMQYLADCTTAKRETGITRFTVQCAIHSQKEGLEHGFAGQILSGSLSVGDKVMIHPQQATAVVRKIINGYTDCLHAHAGQNICLYFTENIKLQRGDIIAHIQQPPKTNQRIEVNICWLHEAAPLEIGKKYIIRINSMETTCTVRDIVYMTHNNTFEKYPENSVSVNQFARVIIETEYPVVYDNFDVLPATGRGIIVDPVTNYTSGAVTIED